MKSILEIKGCEETEEVPEVKSLHFLPCTIHYNGPAKVSCYFVQEKHQHTLKASYRGRALKGIVMEAPKGFVGRIVEIEAPPEKSVMKKRKWEEGSIGSEQEFPTQQTREGSLSGRFDQYVYWTYTDDAFSDPLPNKWHSWVEEVSPVIHKRISEEEMNKIVLTEEYKEDKDIEGLEEEEVKVKSEKMKK